MNFEDILKKLNTIVAEDKDGKKPDWLLKAELKAEEKDGKKKNEDIANVLKGLQAIQEADSEKCPDCGHVHTGDCKEEVEEGVMDKVKEFGKKALDTLGHKDDEELIKDLQKKSGVPQTGKKPSDEVKEGFNKDGSYNTSDEEAMEFDDDQADEEEKSMKESALSLLRRYAGIQEAKIEEDSHEEQVKRLAAYNERMAGENPPIDLGLREVGNWAKVGHYGNPIKTAWYNIAKYGIRNNKFNDSVDRAMSAIGDFPDKYDLSIPEIDALYSAYETVYDQWEQSKGQQGMAEEEFEVGGKKYKVNECGDMEMSPMTVVGGEPQMGINPAMPAEVPTIGAQQAEPEMAQMAEPEEPAATYTLSIRNGENNLQMTTDVPDEIIHIMKLAGVNKGAQVSQKPTSGEESEEQQTDEAFGNTPPQTNEPNPRLHGDIYDWGQKGTGRAPNGSALNKPAGQGDNPLREALDMILEYRKFKSDK